MLTVMRSGSGVIFRFIDAPYDREWMLKNKQPLERWGDIREKLDKHGIDSSNRIDRLMDYRNIIYGSPTVQPAYRKYSLLESKQYQNIPRTITNVFLNTRLESSFIKETIIHSLSEEELMIDLLAYRHHLHDFEKEYQDIEAYLRPKTQEQAEKIINHFNGIRQRRAAQLQLSSRLASSISLSKKELEKQNKELATTLKKQSITQNKQEEREKRHNNKVSQILGTIKGLEAKIREARKKNREYNEKGIKTILARFQREGELTRAARQTKEERSVLTARFDTIESKFQVLKQHLQNKKEQLESSQRQQQNEIERAILDQRATIARERDQNVQSINELHEEKIEELEKQAEDYRENLAAFREERIKLKETSWRSEEIQQLKNTINLAENEAGEAFHAIKAAKERCERLRSEWKQEQDKLRNQKERTQLKLQSQWEKLEKQISDIESKLSRHQDALYGYLEKNYPNWRETIGRVVREDVLFKENLQPRMHRTSDLFFGLDINLKGLDISAKSLKQYELEKKRLYGQLEKLKKKVPNARNKFE